MVTRAERSYLRRDGRRVRCIDLSHTISPGMPVYPGTEPPVISQPCTIDKDGFNERRLTLFSHTGTHLDSPVHILTHGAPLDRLPLEQFCGPAVVLDVTGLQGLDITPEVIENLGENQIDFVIFYTGWYDKWGKPGYFNGFPVLSPETARQLAGRGIKGVGIDTISVDPVHSTGYNIHKILLSRGILVIENLTNLKTLVDKEFTLYCFPLKIEAADGSPVRAVAVLNE